MRLRLRALEPARAASGDLAIGGGMEHASTVSRDFPRLNWMSEAAETVWQPRLWRIQCVWDEITWLSVASGMRRCCIMVIRPGDVAARAQQWARQGLSVLPLYV